MEETFDVSNIQSTEENISILPVNIIDVDALQTIMSTLAKLQSSVDGVHSRIKAQEVQLKDQGKQMHEQLEVVKASMSEMKTSIQSVEERLNKGLVDMEDKLKLEIKSNVLKCNKLNHEVREEIVQLGEKCIAENSKLEERLKEELERGQVGIMETITGIDIKVNNLEVDVTSTIVKKIVNIETTIALIE